MAKRKDATMTEEPEKKKLCKGTDDQPNSTLNTADNLKENTKNIENYMLMKNRQAAALQRPKVFLTLENLGGSKKPSEQSTSEDTKTMSPSLFIRDLQYLLIFALRRGLNYVQPRWCRLLRPGKMSSTVLIVLKDVSVIDFQQYSGCFSFLQGTFNEKLMVAMMNPCQYFSTFNFDMYAVPMTASQLKGFKKKHGSSNHKNGIPVVFPKPSSTADSCEPSATADSGENPPSANSSADRSSSEEKADSIYCRTQLLLSVVQMVEEKYPLPDQPDSDKKYADFVMSKEKYASVTADSPLFAVDCEMCMTSAYQHELTRVSIVNEQNEVIYDELVKPYKPIVNYLTKYSGITKRMLDPVTKRIEDVQKDIRELLPADAILCGQSLGNDLCALKMFHPYVIDTSVIYNMSGSRRMKCSLKRLTFCFLGRVIQESRSGHNSAEDAKATMDLVLLKLRQSLTFGDAVLGGNVTPFQPEASAQVQSAAATSGTSDKNHKQENRKKNSEQQSKPEVVMMRSLFDILDDLNVSACQVGRQSLVSKHLEEPGLKCCQADSDEEACRKAEELCRDHGFTWVEFSAFADLLADRGKEDSGKESSEAAGDVKKRKKALKTLDKHIKKLVEQLPEKCLVTVVMTGRNSRQHQEEHAAAFLHIT